MHSLYIECFTRYRRFLNAYKILKRKNVETHLSKIGSLTYTQRPRISLCFHSKHHTAVYYENPKQLKKNHGLA